MNQRTLNKAVVASFIAISAISFGHGERQDNAGAKSASDVIWQTVGANGKTKKPAEGATTSASTTEKTEVQLKLAVFQALKENVRPDDEKTKAAQAELEAARALRDAARPPQAALD